MPHPQAEIKGQQPKDEHNGTAEKADCEPNASGGIHCKHRPKGRRINDTSLPQSISQIRYGRNKSLSFWLVY
ncbi:MAG: hypothetical protein ACOCM4_06480, partial [Acetivibrio ethanolgignens]